MRDDHYVTVTFDDVLALTPRAIKLKIDGEEKWIPLSMTDGGEDLNGHFGHGTVDVKEWFAEKEGLV